MKSLKITFQTQELPPPFAYAGVTNITFDGKDVLVEYSKEYTNRDTLQEEEILEEGFTEDDDFSWKGKLGAKWRETLEKLHGETVFEADLPEFGHVIHLEGEGKSGYASNASAWEYLLEELQQAAFETEGLEAPFQLEIWIDNTKTYGISATFKDRSFYINDQKIAWEGLRKLFISLESLESDKVLPKPGRKGMFVSFDGLNFLKVHDSTSASEIQDCLRTLAS